MITYQQERLADIQPEIAALVPAQWAEMAQGFAVEPESPRWELYLALERQNKTILLTARSLAEGGAGKGELVGYFGAFLYEIEGKLAVRSTPYYVIPLAPMRRALVLRRLIRLLMEKVEKTGHQLLIKTHPWASAGPILEHLGFRAVETWYMLERPPPQAGTESSDA